MGLSGGVDSSVSAALLKKASYEVTGVFIRVWTPDFFQCNWKDDRLDAMRVCAKLQIPFQELNLEKEYKREVVDEMIREYKAGRTPNPDVACNRFIKFGAFYDWAMKNKANFIATGHYARIANTYGRMYLLKAGLDLNKDQSYFLWQIKKEQLPRILFPIGGMKKPEVRKLAKRFGLITADKKDSQGLCFVGKVDMKEFLSHYIKPKKGIAVDEKGMKVGEHNGAAFYTIGERIGLSKRLNLESEKRFNLESSRAFFVIAKNMQKNTLTVSPKSPEGNLAGRVNEIVLEDYNWVSGTPRAGKIYSARLRYRQPLQEASIKYHAVSIKPHSLIHNTKYIIQFASPQIAAAGQSLVLYDKEVVLGGGIIV